jgi:hypothetical protein
VHKAVPRSTAEILPFLATAASADETLPMELGGRWPAADGRYSDQYDVNVAAQDGTALCGTLITGSGRCGGRPAKFAAQRLSRAWGRMSIGLRHWIGQGGSA